MSTTVRLRLLPGLDVVAREPGVLQVGLDAPRRALLADVPVVRRVLAALACGAPLVVDSPTATQAVADLERAGLLVDHDGSDRLPPDLVARHAREAAAVAERRAAAGVLVIGPAAHRRQLTTMVEASGLAVVTTRATATVGLLVAERELARGHTDDWMRDGLAHLCAEARDGGWVVGPFVVPGVTACLRCVDAHRGEHDPRRPIVLDQLARRHGPAPADPVTTSFALAWAIRDVVAHVDGHRPATWSSTVDLDVADTDVAPTPRSWTRHPHCGCSWDARVVLA